MHEYSRDHDLQGRHSHWASQHAGSHQWDQPASGIHYGDFTTEALIRVVQAGDPGKVRAVGEMWGALGTELAERADILATSMSSVTGAWQGAAVDQFATMVTKIVTAILEASATALNMRDLVMANAELLAEAQRQLAQAAATSPTSAATGGMVG